MAMEILGPIHIELAGTGSGSSGPLFAADRAANVPAPPLVPPAPPLPSHWTASAKKGGLGLNRDSDSGLWSSVDDLPGSELSDTEFNDEFSRRGSADSALTLTINRIPTPPPVPPLPRYLRDLPSIERQLSIVYDDDYNDFYDSEAEEEECIVCYTPTSPWHPSRRTCCNRAVCRECLVNMVHAKIGLEGLVYIECPNPDCDTPFAKTEVLDLLGGNSEMKEKYERMRLEFEGDDRKKACPNCSLITEHEVPSKRRLQEDDVKIKCVRCSHDWCFACQAPWHEGLSCKQFRKGDKHFSKWTKGRSSAGTANCQKCPMCRVYIQRSTGCDHMTCNRCDTHFCYKCGGRFVDLPGLGDHYDRMGVFGCTQNYMANQPIKRKAVRGSYLGAKMAMLTGYPVLFVAGVAVVVTVGIVALPIYGGYRYYKFRKNTNRERRRRNRNRTRPMHPYYNP